MMLQAELHKLGEWVKNHSSKENMVTAVAVVVFLGAWGSYHGYRWLRERSSMNAQVAFSDSLDAYQRALSLQFSKESKASDRHELWEQAEVDFAHAYDKNSGSAYAPYMKAFSAQVAMAQQNRVEALKNMRQSIAAMGRSNVYRGMYQVSLALMLLDGSESEKDEGLKLLELLATDAANSYQDMALYYLGLWYQVQGQSDKAEAYFNQVKELDAKQSGDSTRADARSPWASLIA